jgi:soluble cytochrome b562
LTAGEDPPETGELQPTHRVIEVAAVYAQMATAAVLQEGINELKEALDEIKTVLEEGLQEIKEAIEGNAGP